VRPDRGAADAAVDGRKVAIRSSSTVAAALVALAIFSGDPGARAAPSAAPSELAVSSHFGWEVDRTTGGKICTVASRDECQSHRQSSGPGGFAYPSSVATDPRTGNVYVTDLDNHRVQEFTAAGAFLATFGWDVNETKDLQATAAQAEKDVCTAASGDLCTAGVSGEAAGQLSYPMSVTVAPVTGDVYVLDIGGGVRVVKYTAGGRFVWTVGKDVNATRKANICTEREIVSSGVKCKAAASSATGSLEPRAFKSAPQYGDLLAVGGPENLLYVGDEHRVQELDAEGRWRGEILLASISAQQGGGVGALAVDHGGNLYLFYSPPSLEAAAGAEPVELVRELNQSGEQVALFPVASRQAGARLEIDGIALDPRGTLAVIGVEIDPKFHTTRFGDLYDPRTGRLVGEFAAPSDNDGLTFDGAGDLYVTATDDQEVVVYVPAPASELVTAPVPCEIAGDGDPALTFNCALNREA
jgi:hypothetical protein